MFLPLSCKSRCLTPYFNRECFGLVQSKKLCCKSNHFALSSAVIEAAFLQHKFTPRSKIFSVSWTTVVRSELPGRSSMDGFFPTTLQNTETDQNGLWRHFTWLALLFLWRISTASETDETLTRMTQSISLTHVYMCHAISFMSYDVNDLERFPISQEVTNYKSFPFWISLLLPAIVEIALPTLSSPISCTPPAPCSPRFPPPCPPLQFWQKIKPTRRLKPYCTFQ